MRIAVVADDLTGALDVCAPMAAHGLSCHVALDPSGIEPAIASGADVVCVNTASRERAQQEAVSIVQAVAEKLAAHAPAIAFKKIDSRLQGHVSAETAACLAAFGRERVIVAPAIPAQRRYVENGAITGFGVSNPISVADAFRFRVEVPDTRNQADLDRIAAQATDDVLFAGASGLGQSLATLLGHTQAAAMVRLPAPMLMALGSKDPISLEQAKALIVEAGLEIEFTRDGMFQAADERRSVTLLQETTFPGSPGYASRMEQFGQTIAAGLRGGRYAGVLLCGGETAQTVMKHLGATHARLLGLAAPGIPVLRLQIGNHYVTILTKSGGFGTPDALAALFRSSAAGSTVGEQ